MKADDGGFMLTSIVHGPEVLQLTEGQRLQIMVQYTWPYDHWSHMYIKVIC